MKHRPSAITSGTRECANADADGHRPRATPESIAKAGPEPTNRRGGAPRGEHPRRADCVSGSARDARRRLGVCGPTSLAAKGASQAPERLSALRSLVCAREHCKARRTYASREG